MPKILLPVPHREQRQRSDCLAACAAMALLHLGRKINYHKLLKLLRITPFGTSGHHLIHLTSLGVQVIYHEGTMDELKEHLGNNRPCIALVRTTDMSYWSYETDHAVLVVGFDEQSIYVNDPAFAKAPLKISASEFELAWLTFNYRYAVIMR